MYGEAALHQGDNNKKYYKTFVIKSKELQQHLQKNTMS